MCWFIRPGLRSKAGFTCTFVIFLEKELLKTVLIGFLSEYRIHGTNTTVTTTFRYTSFYDISGLYHTEPLSKVITSDKN